MIEEVMYENQVVGHIETKFLKNKNRPLYIALEEVNLLWSMKQVKEFDEMWNMGFSMEDHHDKNSYLIKTKRKVTPLDINLTFNHDLLIKATIDIHKK